MQQTGARVTTGATWWILILLFGLFVVDFVAAVWDVVVALVVVVDGVPCSPLFLLESQQWVPLLVFP